MSDKDKPLGSPTAQVRIGHYILGDTLGVGTFGKVKLKLVFLNSVIIMCTCYINRNFKFLAFVI